MRRHSLSPNGTLSRWLTSRHGFTTDQLAEEVAATLCVGSGQRIPVDIHSLAKTLGVKRYRRAAMSEAGRLATEPGGFVIELAQRRSGHSHSLSKSERFTVAHELAHTVFFSKDPPSPRRVAPRFDASEEELFCNMVASALLMPHRATAAGWEALPGEASDASRILIMADRYQVSPNAMARRLIEDLALLWGLAFGVRWSMRPGADPKDGEWSWRMTWSAAHVSIPDNLFLPSPSRGPRVRLDVVEACYLQRQSLTEKLAISAVRLGNIRQVFGSLPDLSQEIEVQVACRIPNGLHLKSPSNGSDIDQPTGSELLRRMSELVVFLPARRNPARRDSKLAPREEALE